MHASAEASPIKRNLGVATITIVPGASVSMAHTLYLLGRIDYASRNKGTWSPSCDRPLPKVTAKDPL